VAAVTTSNGNSCNNSHRLKSKIRSLNGPVCKVNCAPAWLKAGLDGLEQGSSATSLLVAGFPMQMKRPRQQFMDFSQSAINEVKNVSAVSSGTQLAY
jgi:hypothetical protein